jgi:hypothetical protein
MEMKIVVYAIITRQYICVVECVLPKFLCRLIHIAFSINTPTGINHMFGMWVLDMNANIRKLFLLGIGTMLWAIWLSRSDVVFDKSLFQLVCGLFKRAHTGLENDHHSKRRRSVNCYEMLVARIWKSCLKKGIWKSIYNEPHLLTISKRCCLACCGLVIDI